MIFLLEDDESIRKLVVYALQSQGFEAAGFEKPSEFWHAMSRKLPELVLLDVMLPGEDGLHVLQRLHSEQDTQDVPVIMLTAKGTEFDKVKGLDGGADDYIVKPFGMAELIARVRARLRRIAPKLQENVLTCGELTVDKRAHMVYVQQKAVNLTMKEYDLLCFLMENTGTAFTREHLLRRIWDYAYDGGTRTVDVHVQTLRSKLGECGSMVETVRGVGYRFGGK